MLTSKELTVMMARDNGVSLGTARDVVEKLKTNVMGYHGYTYDASLDAWLTAYERGYNDAIKAKGVEQ